ncbi:competence/damage-inducible protein A [Fervidobacterium nodosum]|uniref:CinA-like protein n=1 Tax=Fervidobacterium nodosum (strain ATCC 35602 / DSM 5306 / Rt17-B1) TaxID=381764 RepID=CINAL_FERNB|nr:competence/damage-inducible protein A [Fervidobacterium nodosum]A7HNE6.1 RecName: Full=CinA-like protein [Fervidobacterium nodosum Rt17-B1]ABS61429.1 competence/damage-inducible protein CinA [Fervidobacterium nodosum Rt17-B1]
MKKAIILAIGNELVEGLIVDTNSKYLAQRLKEFGYYIVRTETLPDNFDIMVLRIKEAIKDADLIITSGGLGPTEDDLTREAVAHSIGRKLLKNEAIAQELINRAIKYYGKAPESVVKQAFVIENAEVIDNKVGTAPGQMLKYDGKIIILLPGPPVELIPMFESILEKLKTNDSLYTRRIKTIGIPEAVLMDEYKDILYSNSRITIATMASYERGVEVRFTGPIEIKDEIDYVVNTLLPKLGESVYALDDKEMHDVVYELLVKNNYTVSFAESCTGGLISSTFVDIPGVSSVFKGSVVAYSNEAKIEILGVSKETIEKFGAVSEECVIEMAQGAKKIFNSNFSVAVSGIAGPSGGSEKKPVGTVCIAVCSPNGINSATYNLRGDRQMIRKRSTLIAFDMLRRGIIKCQG